MQNIHVFANLGKLIAYESKTCEFLEYRHCYRYIESVADLHTFFYEEVRRFKEEEEQRKIDESCRKANEKSNCTIM